MLVGRNAHNDVHLTLKPRSCDPKHLILVHPCPPQALHPAQPLAPSPWASRATVRLLFPFYKVQLLTVRAEFYFLGAAFASIAIGSMVLWARVRRPQPLPASALALAAEASPPTMFDAYLADKAHGKERFCWDEMIVRFLPSLLESSGAHMRLSRCP